ncbi:MAG: molybdopterin-dependent oxidoreductase [Gemmatimonadales bacterium]
MSQTRREFVWTMGAASAALALRGTTNGVFWTRQETLEAGWQPGIEKHLSSTCMICPARCGIRGRVVDGRLVRISGNRLHPMSRGGLCPRGIAGVQTLYHPQRITAPMVRTGPRDSGGWEEVSREEAISLLSERLGDLRASGRPEGLALLSGYCAGTMRDLWHQFMRAFGSPNYVADEYADGTDAIMEVMHGVRRRPGYDLERSGLVLSFGAPLFESWWSPLQAFVAYADPERTNRRRPRFVQVDTRFSRTAARSHEWVAVRPGTHAVLALGIAYVLVRDELYDAQFVTDHLAGFEDFTDEQGRLRPGYRSRVSSNYRTEEVSAITGVPVEQISSLARAFARGDPSVAVCGEDVMRAPNGLLAGLAVHSLNLLMGSVNRPGTVLFGEEPPLEPLVEPVLDFTASAGLARGPIAGSPLFGAGCPALPFAEQVAESGDDTIRALLLYYANPLASSARPEVWRNALEKVPFVVSFSPFMDETTRHADVILPDLLPYERWQDAPTPPSYPYPVWSLTQPLVEPYEGAIHTAEALLAIARNLGGSVAQSLPYEAFEPLLKARAQGLYAAQRGTLFGSEFEREHHRQMEQRGWWLPAHTNFEAFWRGLVERGGWTDLYYDDTDPAHLSAMPDGRIHLLPASLVDALQAGNRELYVHVAPPSTAAEAEEYPLELIPYRLSTLASGSLSLERWLAERPSVFPDVYWHPWVEVNPVTTKEMGLHDGDRAFVVSPNGRYEVRIKVSSGTAPRTVTAPYGLRHPGGEVASPLRLLDSLVDPLTGLQSWI